MTIITGIILGMMAVTDFKTRKIPIEFNIAMLVVWGVHLALMAGKGSLEMKEVGFNVLTAVGLTCACLLCRRLMPNCIGMGDVLMLLTAILAAGRLIGGTALLISLLIFCLVGVIYMIRGAGRDTALPFAPFYFVGYLISIITI